MSFLFLFNVRFKPRFFEIKRIFYHYNEASSDTPSVNMTDKNIYDIIAAVPLSNSTSSCGLPSIISYGCFRSLGKAYEMTLLTCRSLRDPAPGRFYLAGITVTTWARSPRLKECI
jgi:hypothetical protein